MACKPSGAPCGRPCSFADLCRTPLRCNITFLCMEGLFQSNSRRQICFPPTRHRRGYRSPSSQGKAVEKYISLYIAVSFVVYVSFLGSTKALPYPYGEKSKSPARSGADFKTLSGNLRIPYNTISHSMNSVAFQLLQ